jgi:hypothetical protein
MGIKVYRAGNVDVWLTPHVEDPCRGWIGIFNRSKSDRKVTLTKLDLGLVAFEASYNLTPTPCPAHLRDVWFGNTFTISNDHTFDLPAEDVVFLTFEVK